MSVLLEYIAIIIKHFHYAQNYASSKNQGIISFINTMPFP